MNPFRSGEFVDAADKFRDVFGEFDFRQGAFRAGWNVHNTVAAAQIVQDMRDVLILRTGEYIRMNTQVSEVSGQVADIHVHAAGVFTAQSCQRAGVVGDNCYVHFSLSIIIGN